MTVDELYNKYLFACRIDKKCIFNQLTESQIRLLFEKLLANPHIYTCLKLQPFLFFRRNHEKLFNDEIKKLLESENQKDTNKEQETRNKKIDNLFAEIKEEDINLLEMTQTEQPKKKRGRPKKNKENI